MFEPFRPETEKGNNLRVGFDDGLSPSPVRFFCIRPEEIMLLHLQWRGSGNIFWLKLQLCGTFASCRPRRRERRGGSGHFGNLGLPAFSRARRLRLRLRLRLRFVKDRMFSKEGI